MTCSTLVALCTYFAKLCCRVSLCTVEPHTTASTCGSHDSRTGTVTERYGVTFESFNLCLIASFVSVRTKRNTVPPLKSTRGTSRRCVFVMELPRVSLLYDLQATLYFVKNHSTSNFKSKRHYSCHGNERKQYEKELVLAVHSFSVV